LLINVERHSLLEGQPLLLSGGDRRGFVSGGVDRVDRVAIDQHRGLLAHDQTADSMGGVVHHRHVNDARRRLAV
jgi:hypothetical protein